MKAKLITSLPLLLSLFNQSVLARRRSPADWNDRLVFKNFSTAKSMDGNCAGIAYLYSSLYARVAFDPSKNYISIADLKTLFTNAELMNPSRVEPIVVPGPHHMRDFSDKYAPFLARLASEEQNQCRSELIMTKSNYANICLTGQAYKSSCPNALLPIGVYSDAKDTGHAMNFVDFSIEEGSCESGVFKVTFRVIDPNSTEIIEVKCTQLGCIYPAVSENPERLSVLHNMVFLARNAEKAIANREQIEAMGLDQAKKVIRPLAGDQLKQEQMERGDDPRVK